MLFLCGHAFAQEQVSGTVIDTHEGVPLEGVVVNLIGSQGVSVFTDAQGRYSLAISSKEEVALEFSFADYVSKRVYLHGKSKVDILLSKKVLDKTPESVRTPFGNFAPGEAPGSSVTITGEQLSERGYFTLDNALRGLVPGLLSNSRSGVSASGSTMTLRGASSASANTEPLIVVDGVIFETRLGELTALEGNFYNPLSSIKIKDIGQVTVVKDGMASLYGSLANNGVIFIYTKDSDVKNTRVDFSADFGVSFAPEKSEVMNASAFRSYALDQALSSGLDYSQIEKKYPFLLSRSVGAEAFRYGNDTDWQDEVYQTGIMNRYSANVQGGDEVTSYNFSVGYANNQEVVKNTDYESFDIRMNAKMRLLGSLLVRPQVSLTKMSSNLRTQGPNATVNPTLASVFKSPLMGVYRRSEKGIKLPFLDEYGTFGMSNPTALIQNAKGLNENFRLRAGMTADQRITKSLSAKASIIADIMNMKESSFVPRVGVVPQLGGSAESLMGNNQRNFYSVLSELSFAYDKTFEQKHRVSALAGSRVKVSQLEDEIASDVNSASDKFTTIGRGDGSLRGLLPMNGKWNMLTFYGKLSYAFQDKYYLDAGLSADGSSKFGRDNRFGYFPYVSGAWRVSSESFMRGLETVSDLKIRAGYNVSGNEDIGYYASRFSYVGIPYLNISGIVRGSIPSTGLTWEQTSQMNVGLDLSLWNDRVKATFDAYRSETTDLLTTERLDTYYGTELLVSNGGALQNTGFEAGLTVDALRTKDLGVTLGTTFAMNDNEVTELGDNSLNDSRNGQHLVTDINGGQIITRVGGSIGEFYGYRSLGVITSLKQAEALSLEDRYGNSFGAGDIQFADLNGDGIIDESDRESIGNATPDFFGAVHGSVRYKRLTFNFLFDYAYGNEVFNHKRSQLESASGYFNQSTAVQRRWRYEGQPTDMPKAMLGDPMGNARFSDRWIEDGSFFRLKNVSFSYDFQIRSKIIRSLGAYATASNLFTLSNYLGTNPDIAYGNTMTGRGVDYGQVPVLRSVMLGLKLGI
ncbi:SusC/RagA family TonB-linked outer membrane protein [Fulvitalea axinellae]|uniref:SusC/RagA family TonB-linked outer membrane protein n=2 Tax=Fulvitalea axinellae TaxID=1182444 RepID=A0AAU9CT74_9BACT|nr:SusC/RagA family TonB-linked outer membrane protein [Fulvitalea axinellae]